VRLMINTSLRVPETRGASVEEAVGFWLLNWPSRVPEKVSIGAGLFMTFGQMVLLIGLGFGRAGNVATWVRRLPRCCDRSSQSMKL
jgi:hypothetical protein